MGIGSIINKVCDLFLPDAVGDVIGCVADALTGNIAGAVANGCDAVEDIFDAFGCEEGSAVFSVLSDAAGLAGGDGSASGGLDSALASGVVGVFDESGGQQQGLGDLFGDIAALVGAGDDVTSGIRDSAALLGV
jgi:hypothetical protein